jgi:hypothetical protein
MHWAACSGFVLDSVGPVGRHPIPSLSGLYASARHPASLQAPSITLHPRKLLRLDGPQAALRTFSALECNTVTRPIDDGPYRNTKLVSSSTRLRHAPLDALILYALQMPSIRR